MGGVITDYQSAMAIHLIVAPLAQHREEPLVRRRKELAVIWSATQVVVAVTVDVYSAVVQVTLSLSAVSTSALVIADVETSTDSWIASHC